MNKCRKFLSLLFALTFLCGLFSLSVSAAEPEVEWLIPQRVKIGDEFDVVARGKNLPYNPDDSNIFEAWGRFRDHCLWPHAFGPDLSIYPGGTAEMMMIPGPFCKPGTLTLRATVSHREEDGIKEIMEVGDPYTVVIEEPVITSSAPPSVTVGQEITFSAELTNTSLSNRLVSDYENPTVDRHEVAYRPSITVVEGENLVEVDNLDCSTILKAKANLTFLKPGTVKIQVKYNQMSTCIGGDGDPEIYGFNLYSPEKTFTIQVKDNTPPTSTPSVETSQPTTSQGTTTTSNVDSSTTTSSAPSTSAPTETDTSQSSLVDTDTNIAITGDIPDNAVLEVKPISENEDTYTALQEKLPEQVSRFQSYDINLLDTENVKVQPNGKVQISIPKPDGFGDNLAVYRTEEDGSMTLLNSEVKDGKVIFTTDHFSLYTIAEMEDTPAIAPPSGGIPTGGIVAIVIGALVVVAGGVTAGILLYKKKKSAPTDPA